MEIKGNKQYKQKFLNECLYNDRIDFSEGIDVNKASASKNVIFPPIDIFLDKCFKFQQGVCNRCHDTLMKSMILRNIAI